MPADIVIGAIGLAIGLPSLWAAVITPQPANLKSAALFLAGAGLAAAAGAGAHHYRASIAVVAAFAGVSATLFAFWSLRIVRLSRHNTSM